MQGKSEEEITSAEQSFRGYIQLAQDIQQRIASQKKRDG